jgi:hypothetical protein
LPHHHHGLRGSRLNRFQNTLRKYSENLPVYMIH